MGTDQEWHRLLQTPLFTGAASETSATLAHLSEIFVERHHLVWKVGRLPASSVADLALEEHDLPRSRTCHVEPAKSSSLLIAGRL